ncbi:Cation efflux family protein isoform 1 [Forsythia ovata]|uniref:Cation efflux family protein isoform 1 n=1 Tax=Forsythia ovata TaxID=205694 RepID=A0ABD1PVT9_9LAMI
MTIRVFAILSVPFDVQSQGVKIDVSSIVESVAKSVIVFHPFSSSSEFLFQPIFSVTPSTRSRKESVLKLTTGTSSVPLDPTQALFAYGLSSSQVSLDALHPYGYSKERFVWSLISTVGIFCLGSGATIVHGIQNLWTSQPPEHIEYVALVIGSSFIIEVLGASLLVAIYAVRKGAATKGMKVRDYVWRGHDPTSVAVMTVAALATTISSDNNRWVSCRSPQPSAAVIEARTCLAPATKVQ